MNTDTNWIFETLSYAEWTAEEAALTAAGWEVVSVNEDLDQVILKKQVLTEVDETVPR